MNFDGCMLVSDMDATLLKKDHSVSKKNTEAIKYFTENGGLFTVASGRMMSAVRPYTEHLTINAPAILHNGAMIYDFLENKILFEKNIEEERKPVLRRMFEETRDFGLEVYSSETVYILRQCLQTHRFKNRSYNGVVYSMPDEIWDAPWIKYLIIADNKQKLDEFEPIFVRDYDNGYCVRSGPLYLDIVAGGVSKGIAASSVKRITGSRCMIAVGDSPNDLEMLNSADISFAVENAVDAVKDAADYVTVSNNDDAIAHIIHEHLPRLLNMSDVSA